MDKTEWCTLAEAATALGIMSGEALSQVQSGQLNGGQYQGGWWVRRSSVEEALAAKQDAPTEPLDSDAEVPEFAPDEDPPDAEADPAG